MIVVTGPGRSGTSFVAELYHELGLDPGGVWNPAARAGFEDRAIVRMNHALIRDLGMQASGLRFRFIRDERVPDGPRRLAKQLLPPSLQRRIRSLMRDPPWRPHHRVDVVRWERFDEVCERHGPELRRLSSERFVVKDPSFCWTLGVWAASGVSIEHVLVTVRSLDAMAKSRRSQAWVSPRSLGPIKNWMAYGLGLLMSTIHDERLSHSILRFPDFLSQPDDLFAAMRLPPDVTFEAFLEVFNARVRPEFVHDAR